MRRPVLIPIAGVMLFSAAVTVQADKQRVYQWTDSQGVVHYSQFEPEETKSKSRDLSSTDPMVPKAAPAPAAKPSTFNQANCDMAKSNLDNLTNAPAGQLMTDKDGDGTPDAMSADDIAAAKDLAERQVKRFCEG